jgi:pimeloyl-ACP methyl ester carboxylesterase
MATPTGPSARTIAFIHGMFMTPLCWEDWIPYFQAKGYACLAPAWPGRDQPIETLRANHPDPQLGRLTLSRVVQHMGSTIRNLSEKPILIGHSMGGLVVQLLLQQDLGAAGVAIDSAPPMGVFTPQWSFIRSNWPAITPFASRGRPVRLSFEQFRYAFVPTLPPKDQRAVYDRYAVPESRRVPLESLTGAARIDFRKPHAPLLLIAGSADHIIPPALNRSNFRRYGRSASPTDFKEFAGRDHLIIGEKNWQEVADYIGAWLGEKEV